MTDLRPGLEGAIRPDGTLATGVIDLAYRKNGEWTVIDFKTADTPDPAQALRTHGPQMAVYRLSLAAITKGRVRAALCLLRSGQLVDVGADS